MAQRKKAAAKKKTGTKRRRGVKLAPTELTAAELLLTDAPVELAALEGQVEADGGAVLGRYREPLGAHPCCWWLAQAERRATSDHHFLV